MALPVTRPQTELFIGMTATTNDRRIVYCGYPNLAAEDIPVGMAVAPVDPDASGEIHLVKNAQKDDKIIGIAASEESAFYILKEGRKYYPKGAPVPLLQMGEIVQKSVTPARYGDEAYIYLTDDGNNKMGYISNVSSANVEQITYVRYIQRLTIPSLVWVRYDLIL